MAEKQQDIAAILALPDVQKAIAAEAAKAAANAVAEFAKGKTSILPVDEATRALFSEMAQNMAAMAQQGSGRAKPLAPEIMAKRDKAASELDALLAEVNGNLREAHHNLTHHDPETKRRAEQVIEKWLPRYRVTGKCYFHEQMIEPFERSPVRGNPPIPRVINWSGPPNHSLYPKNAIAKRLTELFRESVGAVPLLKPMSGPNGGQVAPDRRAYWMTFEGRVVQGPPGRDGMALNLDDDEIPPLDRRRMVDPNAQEQFILGTVAPPARNMAQAAVQLTAEQLARQPQSGWQDR